jgi:hypothetical protein
MSIKGIKLLLIVSALYDGLLGAAFLVAPVALFRFFGVTPPDPLAYVQFPALLLFIFAVMFWRIAADPIRRRDQLFYGMALKVSYAGIVFWYQLHGGLPSMWLPWAYADIAFLLLYIWAWRSLSGSVPQS